ncbi:MAG: FtsX-like permease family protein [Luteitalea sp.]|nr:FtsX-like permease family protein [Luteitalea sp.]
MRCYCGHSPIRTPIDSLRFGARIRSAPGCAFLDRCSRRCARGRPPSRPSRFTADSVAHCAREGLVEVRAGRVSTNFIDLMGIPPLAGRGFLPDEDAPRASPVMVVSHGFWQQRLGGDPEAVDRAVYIDDVPYTVVGIMPSAFRTYRTEDFWTPSVPEDIRKWELEAGYELVARLSRGVTVEEARRELQAIAASVDLKDFSGWGDGGRTLGVVPLKEEVVGDSAYPLQLLLAAVAVVLAIACANLAQLLLARSDRRVGEFATRKAIGASSSQLFRLALTESLLLSAAGGMGGVALAYWLLPVLLALAPSEIPRIAEATIDGRVLATAVALVVLTGCAFGMTPALRLARLSVLQAMKRAPGRPSPRSAQFRSALVVVQVAASVTLVALAGLIGRTFFTLLPSNPGFQAESLAAFLVHLPPKLFPEPADRLRAWNELVRRVEARPEVASVGVGSNVPFGHDDGFGSVRDLAERGRADGTEELNADVRAVSPSFFQLFQMPLLRGRNFTAADRAGAPGVAIVNERLARKLARGGHALGRRVHIGFDAPLPAYRIVGVVANRRSSGATTDVWDEIYIPHKQSRAQLGYLIIRSELDSRTLDRALRQEVRAALPQLPDNPRLTAAAMEDLISESVAGPRFSATLVSGFSALALLLAAIGLFGLVAYSVSQRRQELGIRAALGARPRDLVVTITRSAVAVTAGGAAVGLAAGAYLTRFVESQLYAIEPLDVPTFVGAAVLMLVVAGVAAYVPARRAARTDPMTALRYE